MPQSSSNLQILNISNKIHSFYTKAEGDEFRNGDVVAIYFENPGMEIIYLVCHNLQAIIKFSIFSHKIHSFYTKATILSKTQLPISCLYQTPTVPKPQKLEFPITKLYQPNPSSLNSFTAKTQINITRVTLSL